MKLVFSYKFQKSWTTKDIKGADPSNGRSSKAFFLKKKEKQQWGNISLLFFCWYQHFIFERCVCWSSFKILLAVAKSHRNSKSIFYFWFYSIISIRFLIFHLFLGKKSGFYNFLVLTTKNDKTRFFSKILCCCDVIFEIKYPRSESEDLHSYPLPLSMSEVNTYTEEPNLEVLPFA